jgi:hypothetical protein
VTGPQVFRKKPVEITAWQFTGGPEDATPIVDWILTGDRGASWTEAHDGGEIDGQTYPPEPECIRINTLEGTMRAEVGDWIIRGVAGEFYPCKPDIFAQTYSADNSLDDAPISWLETISQAVAALLRRLQLDEVELTPDEATPLPVGQVVRFERRPDDTVRVSIAAEQDVA